MLYVVLIMLNIKSMTKNRFSLQIESLIGVCGPDHAEPAYLPDDRHLLQDTAQRRRGVEIHEGVTVDSLL